MHVSTCNLEKVEQPACLSKSTMLREEKMLQTKQNAIYISSRVSHAAQQPA
jgi:hypothetical protein